MRAQVHRGKDVETGKWVYGNRVDMPNNEVEIAVYEKDGLHFYKVEPESVGEWIGKCDKQDTRIFENDYMEYCGEENDKLEKGNIGLYKFDGSEWVIDCQWFSRRLHEKRMDDWIVAGNTTNNPELKEEHAKHIEGAGAEKALIAMIKMLKSGRYRSEVME